MGDIQLQHSAKGTSWVKKNHLWVTRKKVNGKWVYTYKTEQDHNSNTKFASDDISSLNKELDRWNLDKKEQKRWTSNTNLGSDLASLARSISRQATKSKSIGGAASKANAKAISKKKQKAYSDYESQKRMAASAAGAATRSTKYKRNQAISKYKKAAAATIKKGKNKVRDIITRLTNPEKYAKQQAYETKQKNKAEGEAMVEAARAKRAKRKRSERALKRGLASKSAAYKASRKLTHSASGSTWTKSGAKYVSRQRKNGKWIYKYKNQTAGIKIGDTVAKYAGEKINDKVQDQRKKRKKKKSTQILKDTRAWYDLIQKTGGK